MWFVDEWSIGEFVVVGVVDRVTVDAGVVDLFDDELWVVVDGDDEIVRLLYYH